MLTRLMVIMAGSVMDDDCFAGDGNDRDLASSSKDDNHKTDMISFVYLVIVLSNMYI